MNSTSFYHHKIVCIMSSLHTEGLLHQPLTTARSYCPRGGGSLARRRLHVIAESYKENEGRSSGNIVDENMCILSKRIKEIRIAERSERCSPAEQGWNYRPSYHEHERAEKLVTNFLELILYAGGAFSIPILGGTLILCLTFLVVHLNDL